ELFEHWAWHAFGRKLHRSRERFWGRYGWLLLGLQLNIRARGQSDPHIHAMASALCLKGEGVGIGRALFEDALGTLHRRLETARIDMDTGHDFEGDAMVRIQNQGDHGGAVGLVCMTE